MESAVTNINTAMASPICYGFLTAASIHTDMASPMHIIIIIMPGWSML